MADLEKKTGTLEQMRPGLDESFIEAGVGGLVIQRRPKRGAVEGNAGAVLVKPFCRGMAGPCQTGILDVHVSSSPAVGHSPEGGRWQLFTCEHSRRRVEITLERP